MLPLLVGLFTFCSYGNPCSSLWYRAGLQSLSETVIAWSVPFKHLARSGQERFGSLHWYEKNLSCSPFRTWHLQAMCCATLDRCALACSRAENSIRRQAPWLVCRFLMHAVLTMMSCLAGSAVSAPGLVLYKQYDDPQTIYKGKVEEAALAAWLEEQAAPLVAELDQ